MFYLSVMIVSMVLLIVISSVNAAKKQEERRKRIQEKYLTPYANSHVSNSNHDEHGQFVAVASSETGDSSSGGSDD